MPAAGSTRVDTPPVLLQPAAAAHRHQPGHVHSGPVDGLLVPRDTVVHALPAHCALLSLLATVAVVVATPAVAAPALAAHAALLLALVALARLPPATVARRMVVETPFLVFALALPFVAAGERVAVLGVELSRAGLVGGALLAVKVTLGTLAAVLLSATTRPRDLLAGLDRLRVPAAVVAILSFMLRYLAVVSGDVARMRLARQARGAGGGAAGTLRAVAAGAGALFVRSYERGERVHLAMLARGWHGRMPPLHREAAAAGDWLRASLPPVVALLALLLALPGGRPW